MCTPIPEPDVILLAGLKDKHQEEAITLRGRCGVGVLAQLSKSTALEYDAIYTNTMLAYITDDYLAPNILGRMEYANFYEKITLKHHIVFEDWPIARFCPPGRLGLLELRTLYQALLDDKPLFRRVPDDEWSKLDLVSIRKLYNLFSPTAAHPLELGDDDEDDTNGGGQSGSTSSEQSGPPGGEQSDPAGGSGTDHHPDSTPESPTSSSNVGAEDGSAPLVPPGPPPRGGTRVSFATDQGEAPRKERAKRANAGMSRKEWAAKKAEMEATKKAARLAQLRKAQEAASGRSTHSQDLRQ